MIAIKYCKLQIGCLLIILYVVFIYLQEKRQAKDKKDSFFLLLVITGIINILFDGTTAYTVNHLEETPLKVNQLLHICFLTSIDVFVFMMFRYLLEVTGGVPESRKVRLIYQIPFVINIAVEILGSEKLEYRTGSITNYSMGISAYTCFVMVAVYMLASVVVFLRRRKNMEQHKATIIATYLVVTICVAAYQMCNPQALVTCLVPAFAIISAYLNQENPLFEKLQKQHDEMVMGFATLIENRDSSTGGHIRRTTKYVELLAQEAAKEEKYKDILTKEYVHNLVMAAPMHDIGKVAIPDAILQKPGRLTAEEFEIMKTHAQKGADIIEETFGNAGNQEYEKMAYEVARYHHEKWNGRGYPTGKSEDHIPLCARIMAVADVFDALSSKRCYKDAMPLEQCFEIIEKGAGQDFDPNLVSVFLDNKEKVEKICKSEC